MCKLRPFFTWHFNSRRQGQVIHPSWHRDSKTDLYIAVGFQFWSAFLVPLRLWCFFCFFFVLVKYCLHVLVSGYFFGVKNKQQVYFLITPHPDAAPPHCPPPPGTVMVYVQLRTVADQPNPPPGDHSVNHGRGLPWRQGHLAGGQ